MSIISSYRNFNMAENDVNMTPFGVRPISSNLAVSHGLVFGPHLARYVLCCACAARIQFGCCRVLLEVSLQLNDNVNVDGSERRGGESESKPRFRGAPT